MSGATPGGESIALLHRKGSKSRAPILQEFLAKGVPDEGLGDTSKGKRPLHVPPPLSPSKKQRLAFPEPKPMPRDSSRIREESTVVIVQESRVDPSGKEPVPLDNDEEQVHYEYDDTDTYLTELDDADDESDFETMSEAVPVMFPTSGHFEPVVDFEGVFGVLEFAPAIDTTATPTPAHVLHANATIAIAQIHLEVAQRKKEELELNLAELTKKWDSQVTELQTETKKLSIIRYQAAPIDPRILREQAQKGAHEEKDATINKANATIAIAQIHLEVAQRKKEELELNLAELTKKWDSQVTELQTETKKLSIIRYQAAPIDPRILREQAQKGAHENLL
ncbi:uncharacterized protein A4U43_C01F14890 [Asparagus officinalis]|uniref:Uncharacterized protein n=1 Tax=Asparagus officinalis TaxID=4686 RepID=A0A5P1FT54_ASPOF|nr:uncharacterized protein A4U43_C01F14890 [Asparagus officinalis]